MTVDKEYCFDPDTQTNCNQNPGALLKGRTVFFAVQPRYLNVDIRITIDVTFGGIALIALGSMREFCSHLSLYFARKKSTNKNVAYFLNLMGLFSSCRCVFLIKWEDFHSQCSEYGHTRGGARLRIHNSAPIPAVRISIQAEHIQLNLQHLPPSHNPGGHQFPHISHSAGDRGHFDVQECQVTSGGYIASW